MPSFRYVVVDVFTDEPLKGNALAVFTDARDIPDEQLQPLAREVNFSETVFVYPAEDDGHARLPTADLRDRARLPRAGGSTRSRCGRRP